MIRIPISLAVCIAIAISIAFRLIYTPVSCTTQSSEQSSLSLSAPPVSIPDSNQTERKEDPCRYYNEDYAFRVKMNGHRLNLKYKPRFESDFADAKVTALSTGRMLVGIGHSLYMLDQNFQVQWKYEVPQMLFDYAIIESTRLIYGTAGDNNFFILDATTGKALHRESRNGSAAYGQVVPFGVDQCLVLDNFWGYRMKMSDSELNDPRWWTLEVMADGITAWRGTNELWKRDFPPDADLLVKGDKIYAITKTKTSIYIRKIEVPKLNRK